MSVINTPLQILLSEKHEPSLIKRLIMLHSVYLMLQFALISVVTYMADLCIGAGTVLDPVLFFFLTKSLIIVW